MGNIAYRAAIREALAEEMTRDESIVLLARTSSLAGSSRHPSSLTNSAAIV